MKHKWHDEIVAWAGGAEIEYFSAGYGWQVTNKPEWCEESEYRIKPQPTQEPVFKEGMRVVAKNTAGFHAGVHGVIKTIELRIWVLRDGAKSLVYYDESELEIEVQDD